MTKKLGYVDKSTWQESMYIQVDMTQKANQYDTTGKLIWQQIDMIVQCNRLTKQLDNYVVITILQGV